YLGQSTATSSMPASHPPFSFANKKIRSKKWVPGSKMDMRRQRNSYPSSKRGMQQLKRPVNAVTQLTKGLQREQLLFISYRHSRWKARWKSWGRSVLQIVLCQELRLQLLRSEFW